MTMMINNTEVSTLEQLPDNIQTIMQMVPAAQSWANNLIQSKTAEQYFASPDQLVESVVPGLHGCDLVFLRNLGLSVSARKLLELGSNDVRDLYAWNRLATPEQRNAFAGEINSLLARYHLLSSAELADVGVFLAGLASPSAMDMGASLGQQIDVYHCIQANNRIYKANQKTLQQAFDWAFDRAQNLAEIGRYIWIYLAYQQALSIQKGSKTPPNATDSLNALVETLLPIVEANLECPVAAHPLDQYAMHQLIQQWQETGKNIGFHDISSGLLNLVLNIDLSPEETEAAEDPATQATDFIETLQKQLAENLPRDAQFNQAGTLQEYYYTLPVGAAALFIDEAGVVSVGRCRPSTTGAA